MLNFEGFTKIFKVLHLFIIVFALAWAALPLIISNATDITWIGWFSILTMPSAIMMIVIVFVQKKMFK